jgi:ankyrin repeat protein
LSRAAEKGDEVIVELLLKNGAQPDLEDADGLTPLSRACNFGVALQLFMNRSIVLLFLGD